MHDFHVVIAEDAFASSVAITRDVLATAAAMAPRLGAPTPSWGMYSLEGGPVRLQGGFMVDTQRLPRSGKGRATWILPGLGFATRKDLLGRLQREDARQLSSRIAAHVRAGGEVAASCSAVFLLQQAGVLEGRRATTFWLLAPVLAHLEPLCTVDADRIVITDAGVTTAGASFAHSDLMLHLLRARFGPRLCDAVSRMLLLDGRLAQSPFVIPEMFASGDELVARLAERVESALPDSPSVAELAAEFCVSERTLARRVRLATGASTSHLVQGVKLRRARTLLENSRMSVDQVAAAVGYQDATALRRLMRKTAGANPSWFRTHRREAAHG
jgi:transcriptional regulator GlxA family with amidase domain